MAGGGRKKTTKGYGSINDVLNDEILIEILHRIPHKSAIRCKAVCRHWDSLIPSPYFLTRFHAHHQLATNQKEFTAHCYLKYLFFVHHLEGDPTFQFSLNFLPFFDQHRENCVVVGECNGLLICSSGLENQTRHYICNPITKQWAALPPAPRRHKFVHIGFVCDPYCQIDDDKGCAIIDANPKFKVVRIPFSRSRRSEFEVEIFSSETGQWTDSVMESPKPVRLSDRLSHPIVSNGLLHWLVAGSEILVYDIHNNRVPYIIGRPAECSPLYPKQALQGLGVCCGKLRVCVLYFSYLTIWELDHGTNQPKWNLKTPMDLNLRQNIHQGDRRWLNKLQKGVAFHPEDPDIVYLGVSKNIIVSYNLTSKNLKLVAQCPYTSSLFHTYHDWVNAFVIKLPWWPTPVPPISSSIVL